MPAADSLIEEFRAAGTMVSAWSRGTPRPLSPQADQTAYRVIEEGLTNAIRHAPGRPVSVATVWDAGTLHLTVVNPADCRDYTSGSGLADLAGRLRNVGGSLCHEMAAGQFRLHASLPAAPVPQAGQRRGLTVLGLTVGILLLVILPAVVTLGVR